MSIFLAIAFSKKCPNPYILFPNCAVRVLEERKGAVKAKQENSNSEGEFETPWKFYARRSIKTMDLNFRPYTEMLWDVAWFRQAHVTNSFPAIST